MLLLVLEYSLQWLISFRTNINVSPGSVAPLLTCGGIFSDYWYWKFVLSVVVNVKNFVKCDQYMFWRWSEFDVFFMMALQCVKVQVGNTVTVHHAVC